MFGPAVRAVYSQNSHRHVWLRVENNPNAQQPTGVDDEDQQDNAAFLSCPPFSGMCSPRATLINDVSINFGLLNLGVGRLGSDGWSNRIAGLSAKPLPSAHSLHRAPADRQGCHFPFGTDQPKSREDILGKTPKVLNSGFLAQDLSSSGRPATGSAWTSEQHIDSILSLTARKAEILAVETMMASSSRVITAGVVARTITPAART